MNKLVNIIPKFLSEINNFSRREVTSFAYLSIEKILGFSKSDCIIHSNHELTNDNIISFENIINDIKQNIPIQYILGEAHFYDLKFKVNSSTLIPRGETEELVQYILLHDFISVLEIGTGSGCIAVSIAKNSNANITAIDNSIEALEIANNLRSKKVIGMHWGTFVLSLEPIMEPPLRFKASAEKYGFKKEDAIIYKIGEFGSLKKLLNYN